MSQLSRSQIDKLGLRLRAGESIAREGLELLQQVRGAYDDALALVTASLRDRLGLAPTSRLKTVQTIIEKLKRERGRLSTMQDIAGARLVAEMSRIEQDELVAKIKQLYPGAKEIDRRARPSFGYRAVHVVVAVEGRPVEVQVRTEVQNLWAQLLERLADQWGRQIRYGGPPTNADEEVVPGSTRQGVLDLVMDVAVLIDEREALAVESIAVQWDLLPVAGLSSQAEQALARLRATEARLRASEEKADKHIRRVLGQLHAVFGVGS